LCQQPSRQTPLATPLNPPHFVATR
jgi:hypothetical protein